MASEKLLKDLNDQYNFELLSAYHYLEMAAYCSGENMDGFAHFFHEQAKEEYYHAMKFYDFILDMDGEVSHQGIPKPEYDFKSFLEVFEEALSHEQVVTGKIENLLESAMKENSFHTIQFLQWFIEEQREEENTMKDIIFKLEGIKENFQGLYLLNKELGERPAIDASTFAEE